MNAVDTNVLMYAFDPREAGKKERARKLIAGLEDGVLPFQVACEFISAAGKLEHHGFNRAAAEEVVEKLRFVWSTILPSWDILMKSTLLRKKYSLSFWDSLLISNCLEAGVTRLYSENFSGYASIEGMIISNPFAP